MLAFILLLLLLEQSVEVPVWFLEIDGVEFAVLAVLAATVELVVVEQRDF